MMKFKLESNLKFFIAFAFLFIILNSVSAASTSLVNVQYTQPSQNFFGSEYMRGLSSSQAQTEDAFLDMPVFIPPLGCEPAVVRSDLLESQNVPVFCKLVPLKLNPGMDITRLNRIYITQKSSNPMVSGVGFHPAQDAITRLNGVVGASGVDNLGYVVVVLKQQDTENMMPSNVTVTLSASLDYGANYAYGIGDSEYSLPMLSEEEFMDKYQDFSFMEGIGYLRVEQIDATSAVVSIYNTRSGGIYRVSSQRIEIGKTSNDIYLTSSFGGKGLKITLKDISIPDVYARIRVNGQQDFDVYRNQPFYNGKCNVLSINPVTSGTGTVSIRCGTETVTLSKKFSQVGFEVNSKDANLNIGQNIDSSGSLYLSYLGYAKNNNQNYVFISDVNFGSGAQDSVKAAQNNLISSKIGDRIAKLKSGEEISSILADKSFITSLNISNLYYLDESSDMLTVGQTTIKLKSALNSDRTLNPDTESFFQKAIASFDFLKINFGNENASSYSNFKYPNYNQKALVDAYLLATKLGQNVKARELLSAIENNYPQLKISEKGDKTATELLNEKNIKSYEGSSAYIEKEALNLELVQIQKPSLDQRNAVLVVNGARNTFAEGDSLYNNGSNFISLKTIEEKRVLVDYSCGTNSKQVYIDSYQAITDCGNIRISIDQINLNRVAKIKLIPSINSKSRENNFTFSIGIEKRAEAMKLTPDQANNKIKDLDKQIAEFGNITEKLGEVIKGMKLGCWATSSIINLKNLVNGLSGDSSARTKTMEYWNNACQDAQIQSDYKADSVDDCIAKASSKIETEVGAMKTVMNTVNGYVSAADSSSKTKTGLNDQRTAKIIALLDKLQTTSAGLTLSAGGVSLSSNEISGIISAAKLSPGVMDETELSSLLTSIEIIKSSGFTEPRIQSEKSKAISLFQAIERKTKITESTKTLSLAYNIPVLTIASENIKEYSAKTIAWSQLNPKPNTDVDLAISYPKDSDRVIIYSFTDKSGIPKNYLAVLTDGNPDVPRNGMIYGVRDLYVLDANNNLITLATDEDSAARQINIFDSSNSYTNTCKNCNYAEFFVLQPYRGMPALLPFDPINGWYVLVDQTFPGLGTGNQKSYQDSGQLNSFWLCNVDSDGYLDGKNKDVCRRFDFYTGASIDSFPGLDASKTKNIVMQAVNAVKSAQSQFASNPNLKEITINGKKLMVKNKEGNTGSKCTDFMSATDCQIVFNVCDPVICPNSRCDFNGKYPVDNVIQSGIVGSTLLCLPNFIAFEKETGVLIPVCLTGINAGLDGWTQILKSYRDCLKEQIATNKTTGICDEVQSVYTCDFFLRQAGPLVQAGLENVLLTLTGQGQSHGGGEYLFVQDAFNTAEKSTQWMQTMYGKDSNLKFGFKDVVATAGAEICKGQVSATYPTDFDSMLEPESPVQFHGSFEEVPQTSATVPSTSMYKVFFNIYAGKEQGHSYSVYLKGSPETPGYYGKDSSQIAAGYVNAGQTATATQEMLDVSGFKELCIRIDLQEHCGFKTVSTSAAVNYLTDKAKESAANQKATSEAECVNGGRNVGSFITPNIQQGVEEFVNPEIYNQGIIRVCATANPGAGTEPSRWTSVGNCGNSAVTCWLDSKSVKNAIQNSYIQNQTLAEAQKTSEQLNNLGGYLSGTSADAAIENFTDLYDSIVKEIIGNKKTINYLLNGKTMDDISKDAQILDKNLVLSSDRARVWAYVAVTQAKLAEALDARSKQAAAAAVAAVGGRGGTTVTTGPICLNKKIFEVDVRNIGDCYLQIKSDTSSKFEIYYVEKMHVVSQTREVKSEVESALQMKLAGNYPKLALAGNSWNWVIDGVDGKYGVIGTWIGGSGTSADLKIEGSSSLSQRYTIKKIDDNYKIFFGGLDTSLIVGGNPSLGFIKFLNGQSSLPVATINRGKLAAIDVSKIPSNNQKVINSYLTELRNDYTFYLDSNDDFLLKDTSALDSPNLVCQDSDGGKKPFIKGTVTLPGLVKDDVCIIPSSSNKNDLGITISFGESDDYFGVMACSGTNCFVSEYFCLNSVGDFEKIVCDNGCSNGACLSA